MYPQYHVSHVAAEIGLLVDSLLLGEDNMRKKSEEQVVTEIATTGGPDAPYEAVFGDVSKIIDAARESAARSVNAAMTAAYWLIGRRIVEFEQSGAERAEYGAALMERLAADLTRRFGRGFSSQNIYNMRLFYLSYQPDRILQTAVWRIGSTPWTADSPDAVWRIGSYLRRSGLRRPSCRPFPCPGPPTCGCCR